MGLLIRFVQLSSCQMGVDLGRGDRGVPEHFLHRPQIHLSLERVGGKRVAQGMRRDIEQSDLFGVLSEHQPESLARDRSPPAVQEEKLLLRSSGQARPAQLQIFLQSLMKYLVYLKKTCCKWSRTVKIFLL